MWPFDLLDEAVSNYVTFAAGIVLATIAWAATSWWARKRPSIVKVELERIVSLLEIAPPARQKLNIIFRGHQVNELHQTILAIYNEGEDVIRDVSIIIDSDEQDTSLDFESWLEDPIQATRAAIAVPIASPDDPDRFRITVMIPYINPQRPHGDRIRLLIYSSKPFGISHISGGGPGWSVRYFDRVALMRHIVDFAFGLLENTPVSALSQIMRPRK